MFYEITWPVHINLCMHVHLVFYNIIHIQHTEMVLKIYIFTWTKYIFDRKAPKFDPKAPKSGQKHGLSFYIF